MQVKAKAKGTYTVKRYVIGNTYAVIKKHQQMYIVITNLDSREERVLLYSKAFNSAYSSYLNAVGNMLNRINDLSGK